MGTITEIAGGSITTQARGDISLYADNIDFQATEKVVWNGKENGVILGTNPRDPDEGKVLVKSAYFAKKVTRRNPITRQDYTVESGDTHASIAEKIKGVKVAELKKAYPTLEPGHKISLKIHNTGTELTLERIEGAGLGAELFIVVETAGLQDKTVTIEILGSNNITFVAPSEAVTVLAGEEEKTSLTAVVGAFTQKTEYFNAAAFANKAVAEFKLAPKDAAKLEEWKTKITNSEEKKAYLHLQVKADAAEEVIYYNEDEVTVGTSKEQGIFVNKKNKWFVVTSCFCYRDITEPELKAIIREMRTSEKRTSSELFTAANCPLDEADKTYTRLCEELNKAFTTHQINTCIRKLHFMGQIYWEGDRLNTTLEYSSGTYLNPGKHKDAEANGNTTAGDGPRYKGRGLMQLTWRNSQKAYLEYMLEVDPALLENKTIAELLDRKNQYTEGSYQVDGAGLIARKLFLAVDSAGWFWDKYKKSAKGYNLNELADYGDTNTNFISRLVNGGGNGLNERKTYYERLRDNIFKFKDTCANYDAVKK